MGSSRWAEEGANGESSVILINFLKKIDTLIYHRIVLPRLLELDASLVPLLHAGKLALPDGTVVAPQPVQPKGDENRLPRLEELLEAGELEGLRRSAAEFLGVS